MRIHPLDGTPPLPPQVNMLLLATSWTFRDHFIIPVMAAGRGEGDCDTTSDPTAMTPRGLWSGTNISWYDDKCTQNYQLCFSEIGSAPWLPALTYLPKDAYESKSLRSVLCDEDGVHYDRTLCDLCGERQETVHVQMFILLVALEHGIVFAKLLLAGAVPDASTAVRKAEARRAHDNGVAASQSAEGGVETKA